MDLSNHTLVDREVQGDRFVLERRRHEGVILVDPSGEHSLLLASADSGVRRDQPILEKVGTSPWRVHWLLYQSVDLTDHDPLVVVPLDNTAVTCSHAMRKLKGSTLY